jgi:hypothetical protein
MFIDLASTAPTLDYRRCPKQLVLRVADVPASVNVGEGFVCESGGVHPQFKPVVEVDWFDRETGRQTKFREYIIQPGMFHEAEGMFEMNGYSAVRGVRDVYTSVYFVLNYDGKSWDLGVDSGLSFDNDGIRLWIPLPDYDPLCTDLTPLQEELEAAKTPEPPKKRKNIWERLQDDD